MHWLDFVENLSGTKPRHDIMDVKYLLRRVKQLSTFYGDTAYDAEWFDAGWFDSVGDFQLNPLAIINLTICLLS